MVREGRVLIPKTSGSLVPQFASDYRVVVLPVGAMVASASSSTTINVQPGHGFSAGQKFIVDTDTDRYRTVASVTSTTVVTTEAVSVAAGEFLINLGSDTGTSAPLYDGSGLQIYQDSGYVNEYVDQTTSTDSVGRYRYHHKGISRWELVLDTTGEAYTFYTDTNNPADEDQVAYGIRYAHLFATSGNGTAADPYPGAAIQAAFDDIATGSVGGGGIVRMIGVFDLGSGSVGLDFTNSGDYASGITVEGYTPGNQAHAGNAVQDDDATELLYSGNGAAIKIGHYDTSNSFWCERMTLRNFKLRQNGTAGTGIGILARLFRFGRIENITVADFATGIAMSSVSDFNILDSLTLTGNSSFGLDLGRSTDEVGNALLAPTGQCNSNRITNSNIRNTARNNGATAWGVYIQNNGVGNIIENSQFHDFNTATYGAIAILGSSSDVTATVVSKNYFEGNYVACYHNNPGSSGTDCAGVIFTHNYVTQIEAYGLWVNSGSTGLTYGVICHGNVFNLPTNSSPYNNARGIQLGTGVTDSKIGPNVYKVQSPLGYTLTNQNVNHGSLGTITEDEITIGTLRVTGAVSLASGIAGGTPYNAGTWVNPTATSGTDTACTNGTAYVGTVKLGANATITGVQFLIGSVGGTDKVIASLHDSTGALLANSDLAGVTVGTAANLQQVAFTATYAAKGPATYFVALTFNGTTAKFRSIPAFCNAGNGVIGNGVTQTFGTAAAFTAPTSFTADKVPVASLY